MNFNPSTVPPGRFFILLAVITGIAVTLGTIGWPGHDQPRQVVKDSKERKGAPDFELKDSSGKVVHLSDYKGKVVLLDFWATWCGPCMQTMPLVEKALEEFDPKQVRLVAVNLEEPAKNVQSVLARHNLHVPVALDEDGVAARKYEANAIPQTVIVDREGKVHRLYVGGGPDMVEQLTASLKELLAPAGETAKPAPPATGS